MKKFYITLSLLVCFVAGAMAQTALENYYHTFKPGDEHHFILTNKVEEGSAGYDMVWDFSGLKKKSELKSHMLLTSKAEESEQFPEANIVLEEYGNHFYFKMSGNSMKHYGTVTKNSVIRYEKPAVKMVYPFEYGQAKEGEMAGTLETSRGERKFTGSYSIEVDGYGRLILPGGVEINDVVRLKTVKKKQYEKSSHTSTIVSYKWYCQHVRYPLLTIIKSVQPNRTYTMKTAYYANAEAIAKSQAEASVDKEKMEFSGDIKVYPNPFGKTFKVDYTLADKGDVRITIFDNTGKIMKDLTLKDQAAGAYTQTVTADEDKFVNGIYHVKIQAGNKETKQRVVKMD
jgi:hypothetical protein